MTESIATLRGKLQQLEALHKSGALGKKDYEKARAPLERQLLDQVLADTGAGAAPTAASNPAPPAAEASAAALTTKDAPRPPLRLVLTLAAVVLVLAGAGYAWTGSPSLLVGVPPAAPQAQGAPHEMNGEQFAAAVERLAEKLKDQPDNVEGWAMLARSYVQLGRFPDAVPAFAKAVALRSEDASLLADYADAMAVANNRTLEGEPTKLIERALKADPKNLKALALAGTAAYDRKDYAGAVRYWEQLARNAPADSPFANQLGESIAEARKLAGMPAAATTFAPAAAPPAAPMTQNAPAAPAEGAAATASAATVRGTVRLAPAVAKLAAPEDTVFIYARAAEGPRMPLAILRKQVKDLPFAFTLDDSMAMSPAMKMSTFPKIVIDARVSKNGQAQAGPGDITGRSAPIDHNASGVVVEIADVVK